MTQPIAGGKSDKQREVREFHANDDLNSGNDAHHHSIGKSAGKSAPGPHIHDGLDSETLLSGPITGNAASLANLADVVKQIIVELGDIGLVNGTSL